MGGIITGKNKLKIEAMSLLDVFQLMFPPDHHVEITPLANARLQAYDFKEITKGELIKFFAVIILGTQFLFRRGGNYGVKYLCLL